MYTIKNNGKIIATHPGLQTANRECIALSESRSFIGELSIHDGQGNMIRQFRCNGIPANEKETTEVQKRIFTAIDDKTCYVILAENSIVATFAVRKYQKDTNPAGTPKTLKISEAKDGEIIENGETVFIMP